MHSWETLDGRTLHADKFVVTSGAWSFELLRANAMKLNIKPMRGQILLYQQPTAGLRHMLYHEGFYMVPRRDGLLRSEEHTSELQSLMRISYAVFCLQKK